jgi:hypothetical protein
MIGNRSRMQTHRRGGLMTAKTMIGFVAAALVIGGANQGLAQSQTPAQKPAQPQKQIQRQAQLQPPDWDRIFRSVVPQPQEPAQNQNPKQRQKAQDRAPTRVVVRPAQYYRYDSTEFPRSDNLGFPGRNAVRQCMSRLAPEHRPSGTVLTPQTRCWWERG